MLIDTDYANEVIQFLKIFCYDTIYNTDNSMLLRQLLGTEWSNMRFPRVFASTTNASLEGSLCLPRGLGTPLGQGRHPDLSRVAQGCGVQGQGKKAQ